jgi:hypothetical protein
MTRQIFGSTMFGALAAFAATLPSNAQTLSAMSWGVYSDFPYCSDLQNLVGGVKTIAVGPFHTLVLGHDGIVRGFGCSPTEFGCDVPSNLTNVVAISVQDDNSLALKADGTIVGWGTNDFDEIVPPANIGPVTAISTGVYHSVALKQDGSVVTWGWMPATPADVGTATAVAAGAYHTLALRSNGTVRSWGDGVPAATPVGLVATAIAGGSSHSMALRPDGTVVCWGANNAGQCNTPTNLANVVKIAAGWNHSVALTANGKVRIWGSVGTTGVPASLPPAAAIAAGSLQTFAFIPTVDCDASGTLDYCEIIAGAPDCNGNGLFDSCELASGAPDCNGNNVIDSCDIANGTVDCDGSGIPDECETDCNGNGIPDTIELRSGTAPDLNENGIIDECDDPFTFVCDGDGPLAVNLLLVADTSGSMLELSTFCGQVLQPARTALAPSFDLRVTWFDLASKVPGFCGDSGDKNFTLQTFGAFGTRCGDDGTVDTPEDWGLGSAILCDPYVADFAPGWTPRAGVTIIMPLSDEAPEDGSPIDCVGSACCDAADENIATVLVDLARRWAVQIMPAAFPGTPLCVFSGNPNNPGLMDRIAEDTRGSVVDLRTLSQSPSGDALLAQQLESKIRAAVAVAPRLACPPSACVADLDGNGAVGAPDLGALLAAWGTANPAADITGDGSVGPQDLATLLAAWGPCPG